jgi:hypothetical protein
MLEQLQAMQRGEASPPPIAKLLGFQLAEQVPNGGAGQDRN